MEQDDISALNAVSSGIASSYFKLAFAVIIGAALGLGIYFLLLNGQVTSPGNTGNFNAPSMLCICPDCGTVIPKPANLDCEEINCPNCGRHMSNGATLAAGTTGNPPLTQNQRETLAERGVVTPGPMTQNQRETLAERNINVPQATQPNPARPTRPTLAAIDPPLNGEPKCVCPNCGKVVDGVPGFSCSHVRCPVCQTPMTNVISVGPRHDRVADLTLAAMGGPQNCPQTGAGGNAAASNTQAQGAQAQMNQGACPHVVAQRPPCLMQGGAAPPCQAAGGGNSMTGNADQQVTYTNTISGIISRNCLKCHGGPIRSLTTYDRIKAYADNGLLEMMVQPGGPMSRFLTAHESHQITQWVAAGAPQ